MKDLNKKVLGIISKVINIDIDKISTSNAPRDFHKWDSLATLKIITEIEKDLKIKLNFATVFSAKSIQELINIISKK